MAAENSCVICLIGAMDRLWFHQIILFSEPSLFHLPEDPKKMEESSDYSSKNSSQTSVISEQEITQEEISSQESTDDLYKERPTRLTLLPSKTRFHSSSPISAQKKPRNLGKLQKTMSCKSLVELELEEVKGFMDLGFIFRKENLSKRVINLVPGLQRIDDSYQDEENNDDDDDDDERESVMRPYLSEAWIIKRPDSPLLNLRIPRVSTAEDMKKHLKYWAQTVASAIQQDS